MEQDKKRKQIIFDVSEDIHREIKVFSAMRNITMNRWMQKAINERLAKETKYDEKGNLPEL